VQAPLAPQTTAAAQDPAAPALPGDGAPRPGAAAPENRSQSAAPAGAAQQDGAPAVAREGTGGPGAAPGVAPLLVSRPLDGQPGFAIVVTGVVVPRGDLRPAAGADVTPANLQGLPAAVQRPDFVGPGGTARELQDSALRLGGRPGEAATPVERAAAAADEAAPALLRAGLLAEAAPADAAPLDIAIREFLGTLDGLGRDLTQGAVRNGPLPWVLLAFAGAAVIEVGRRNARRRRGSLALAGGADEDTLTWVPGLPGPVAPEEP
jgi:hypothetical protein